MSLWHDFSKGIWKENPVLILMLGMCPSLATTTSGSNALGMGLATAFVLVCSNLVISSIRKIVPGKIRIPCYIVVIAAFVTVVDLLMQAYTGTLYKALGIFIPLIVVNVSFSAVRKPLPPNMDFFPPLWMVWEWDAGLPLP